MHHNLIARAIRTHQRQLEHTGQWWITLHEFTERTLDEFWFSSTPYPIMAMSPLDGGLSCYDPMDGLGLQHRITFDPFKVSDGIQVAELLAHELMHLHEDTTGVPTVFNVHGEKFHQAMFERYGIATAGENGHHQGNDGRWDEWLEANLDLQLARFRFGGSVGGE